MNIDEFEKSLKEEESILKEYRKKVENWLYDSLKNHTDEWDSYYGSMICNSVHRVGLDFYSNSNELQVYKFDTHTGMVISSGRVYNMLEKVQDLLERQYCLSNKKHMFSKKNTEPFAFSQFAK